MDKEWSNMSQMLYSIISDLNGAHRLKVLFETQREGTVKLDNIPILNNNEQNCYMKIHDKTITLLPDLQECGAKKFSVISNNKDFILLQCRNCLAKVQL